MALIAYDCHLLYNGHKTPSVERGRANLVVEIEFDFLRKYSEYTELYKKNKLPVMICDSQLNVGWGNQAAIDLYPHLTKKKGFDLLLSEFDKKTLLERMKTEGSIWIDGLIGFSDILLSLTPVIKGRDIYCVIAELMGKSSVILPPKSIFSSQTPARLEESIRESVAEIFRVMDVATSLEHLLMEKSELRKLGIDTGFISSSFDSISRQGYHLLRMAENLSVYSGLNAEPPIPQFRSVDIFEHISRTKDTVKSIAAKMGISVEFSLPEYGGLIGLDPEKFELAFFNILNNALYFTREGNYVTIAGESCEESVSVTVSDHGIGISTGDLPYIFEPYFSRRRRSDPAGIGLGLTVAKAMIEAQNGKISVISVENEGTEVTITIPRGIFTRRPVGLRSKDNNPAADRFSHLYTGLIDAAESPYNPKNK